MEFPEVLAIIPESLQLPASFLSTCKSCCPIACVQISIPVSGSRLSSMSYPQIQVNKGFLSSY